MPDRAALHVFAYDIASDRLRARVAKMLEDHGIRVQDSVFEIRADRAAIRRLAEHVAASVAAGDSVRVYLVSDDALSDCIAHGGPPIAERQDFWLL